MTSSPRRWEIRPTLITAERVTPERFAPVVQRLRSAGHDFTGLITHGPSGATAIGGTFLAEAATPGEASDLCIDALVAAAEAENLRVVETQEVVVVPGWRDERDW